MNPKVPAWPQSFWTKFPARKWRDKRAGWLDVTKNVS